MKYLIKIPVGQLKTFDGLAKFYGGESKEISGAAGILSNNHIMELTLKGPYLNRLLTSFAEATGKRLTLIDSIN